MGRNEEGRGRTTPVEQVLEEKEQEDLLRHELPGREGNLVRLHAEELCHGVEELDLRARG